MPYDMYTGEYVSEQGRRARRRGPSAFVVVLLALIAGAGGGFLSFKYASNTAQPGAGAGGNVTIQSVEPDRNAVQEGYGTYAQAVAASAAASVVEVTTESKVTHPFFGSYVTGGAGSGVILSDDGYIVTNHHVVSGASSISVRTNSGYDYAATLIGTDQQTDLAVIKIDAQSLSPAAFADSDLVQVGQPAIAIGNPLGTLGGTVTEGIISAKDRELNIDGDVMTLLQTSAAINPGNSGGGLFDRDGSLVGVVNAKSSGSDIEGLGFAIPANTVRAVVQDLIESGYVKGRPVIGISVVEVNSYEGLYRYRVREPGLYISAVAGADGLQPGDLIVQANGVQLSSEAELKAIVRGRQVGDALQLTLRRNSRDVSVTVTLQERSKVQARQDVI